MTRQKPAQERREQILQAAASCFARKGYHMTTMDDIVAESGLSKGSLYWHFESKEDVMIALTLWYMNSFNQQLNHLYREDISTMDKLRATVDTFSTALEEMADLMSIAIEFMSLARSSDKMKCALKEIYDGWIDGFTEVLEMGITRGEVRPCDTRSLAALIIGAYDGLMLQDLFLGKLDWLSINTALLDMMQSGIIVSPPPGNPA